MRDFADKYLGFINGKFKSLNLTRITEPEEFYTKQVVDSVYPTEKFDFLRELFKEASLVIDVGFGGGFPILPLAYGNSEINFLGIEARRKKADAVREIAQDIGLKNVKTIHSRIESLFIDCQSLVTLKAVGKVTDYLDKIHVVENSHIVFYKGPNVDDLEKVPSTYKGFELVYRESYQLAGVAGRNILVYQSKNVPRGTKKDLVKLTSLY